MVDKNPWPSTLHSIPFIINGVRYDSVKQASDILGLPYSTLHKHVKDLLKSRLSEREVTVRIPKVLIIKKIK